MKKLVILAYRFGESVSVTIGQSLVNHYLDLAQLFTKETCEPISVNNKSIPITNHDIENYPYKVFKAIDVKTKNLKKGSYVFLFDLYNRNGIIRGTIILELFIRIQLILNEKKYSGNSEVEKPKCIILLPEMISQNEANITQIKAAIDNEQLIIISDEGEIFSKRKVYEMSKEEYKIKIASIRGGPSDLIKKKIIRRLGHFKRKEQDGKEYCVRYFFDGRMCENEIKLLIEEYLFELKINKEKLQIIYHCPMSSWMEKIVLSIDLNNKPLNINITENYSKIDEEKFDYIVLLVDMIDSGKTTNKIICDLAERNRGKLIKYILAVLAVNPTNTEDMEKILNIHGKDIKTKYLLNVSQKRYSDIPCPMCKLELPITSPNYEECYELTSYDHWEMAQEAKLKNEDNSPQHRNPKEYIIDYPKMLIDNGAWLSCKVKQMLYSRPEGYPSDLVLVCPAGEKGSSIYAEYLKLSLDCSIIEIPRNIISIFSTSKIDYSEEIENIISSNPEWYKSLISLITPEVIVIDEFNVTGLTCSGIMNIIHALGKTAACYFPLNDLNPLWSEKQDFNVYSLYEWQSIKD